MCKDIILRIKIWYITFLEKEKLNYLELFFYFSLYVLSFIYGAFVKLRNFLYDTHVKKSYTSKGKVISIGNLSWAGTGKTSLALYLYLKLSANWRACILRRGYGQDEGKLLRELSPYVFSSRNRLKLVREFEDRFDIFILDDGFQYRSLNRGVDIVIMAARDFRRSHRLIPAYFFREHLDALRRANILIINHKEEIIEPLKIKDNIMRQFPNLKVYFARYIFKKICDLHNREVSLDFLRSKNIACFTAIGYPDGFLNKIRELNLQLKEKFIYPDHYNLNKSEFNRIEDSLSRKGIKDMLITRKDKFHLPRESQKLNILILEVELKIEEEEDLLKEIINYVSSSQDS